MYRKTKLLREWKTKLPRVWKIELPRERKAEIPTPRKIKIPTYVTQAPFIYDNQNIIKEGVNMVNKQMYHKILKLKNKGYSRSRIARELNLTRKTVSKYIKMCEEEYKNYRKRMMIKAKSFDKYLHDILEVYEKNNYGELPMSSVYDYLEEKHGVLPGTEKTLRNYIHYLEETNQLVYNITLRFYKQVPELPYGKQLQVDFGEYTTRSKLKLYIFAAVLSASRYKYIIFQDKPFTTLDLIKHLLECFDYLCGMPYELVIDQDSIMVVSENYGDIIYTKDFQYFIDEMGLKMYVCRKADPESKGKIENLIKYVKHNFFPTRDFKELEEANRSVMKWLSRRANGRISQATKRIPKEIFQEEKVALKPIRNSIYRKDSLIGRESRIVDDKALISVGGSQYSLPSRYKNKNVEIYRTDKFIYVYDIYTGDEIWCHDVSSIPGKDVIIREHYRETEKTAKELKEEVKILFSLENWKYFTEKNFKTYSRYVRDQCIYAKKHFKNNIDTTFLDCALNRCLEDKNYSMKDLYDTYLYYLNFREEEEKSVSPVPRCLDIPKEKREIEVDKRDLSEYKTIVDEATEVIS